MTNPHTFCVWGGPLYLLHVWKMVLPGFFGSVSLVDGFFFSFSFSIHHLTSSGLQSFFRETWWWSSESFLFMWRVASLAAFPQLPLSLSSESWLHCVSVMISSYVNFLRSTDLQGSEGLFFCLDLRKFLSTQLCTKGFTDCLEKANRAEAYWRK